MRPSASVCAWRTRSATVAGADFVPIELASRISVIRRLTRRLLRVQARPGERPAPYQQLVSGDRVDDRTRISAPIDQTGHEQHLKVPGHRGRLRRQSGGDPADLL